MNFTVDFLEAEQRQRRAIRGIIVGLVFLAFVVLLYSAFLAVQMHAEVAHLQLALEKQREDLSQSPVVVEDALEARETVKRINNTINHQGEPTETVLAAVSAAMPVNVRVKRFQYGALEGTGSVNALSASTLQLSDFVRDLERAESIDRVVVTRQEAATESNPMNEYEIFFTAEP